MKNIKIFLASTFEEFKQEQNELLNFIYEIGEQFENMYNVTIKPLYMNKLLQDYTQMLESIKDCELCFFVVFKKSDEKVEKEFSTAYHEFKKNNGSTPKIYVYFKNLQNDESVSDSVKSFMGLIDKDLGHYHGTFDHIDTIKLRILLNIKTQNKMDYLNIDIEDKDCVINGTKVLNLDNVLEFANSEDLKYFQQKLMEVEDKYLEMQAVYESRKMDDDFYKEYVKITTERNDLKEKIKNLRKSIFDLSLGFSNAEVDGIKDIRLKKAYRLMEQGDSRGCLAVLNEEELNSEYYDRKKDRNLEAKEYAIAFIKRHKFAIGTLKTMFLYDNRFAEIESRYETCVNEAIEYKVELDVLYDYASYLRNQNNHCKAIEIAEQLLKYWDKEDISKYDNSRLHHLLALLYSDTQRYDLAEEIYIKKIEKFNFEIEKIRIDSIKRGRVYENFSLLFKPNLANSYNNLALLYSDIQRYELAEELYKKAIEIYKGLVNNNRQAFEPYLASIYNNLANLYRATQRYDLAEELYKKVIEIRERLTKENPQVYEPDLANSYNNLALLYDDTQRYDLAEELYKKAIEIYKGLVNNNRQAFEPYLASIYNNLAILYDDTQRYDLSEELHKKAINIRERLVKENSKVYEPDLADSYNNLACLYRYTQRYDKAEELYKKAIEIRERLVKDNPQAFEPDLADSYNNIALLYHYNLKNLELAEDFYEKAIEIREKLVEENLKVYGLDLVKNYRGLATLYDEKQKYGFVEELYEDIIAVYERLAQEEPKIYEPNLAVSYLELAKLYRFMGQESEAQKYFDKTFYLAITYKDIDGRCKEIYQNMNMLC